MSDGNRLKMFRAACALALMALAISVRAEPNKAEYELAARCGKDVAAWFKSEFGVTGSGGVVNTDDGQATVGFENHYNRKLNKCFFLESYRSIPYKKKDQQPVLLLSMVD